MERYRKLKTGLTVNRKNVRLYMFHTCAINFKISFKVFVVKVKQF